MRDNIVKKTGLLVMYSCLVCVYVMETISRLPRPVACITPIAVVLFCVVGWLCVAFNKWRPERMVCAGLGALLAMDAAIMFVQASGLLGLRLGFDRLALAGFFFYRLSRLNQSLDGGR